MTGHIVFDGPTRRMKFFIRDGDRVEERHAGGIECHDVGIRDGVSADPYGHQCKCPPGLFYIGAPQHLSPPEAPYGHVFTPLYDNPTSNAFAAHGRDGIGVHGGGSDLPDPFAPSQGWEWTFGCLRLQNIDNETIFVPFVEYIRAHSPSPDTSVTLTVFWGLRGLQS